MHLQSLISLIFILLQCSTGSSARNNHKQQQARKRTFPHAILPAALSEVDGPLANANIAPPIRLNSNGASGLVRLDLKHHSKLNSVQALGTLVSNARLRAAVKLAAGGKTASSSSSSLDNEQNSFVATVQLGGNSFDLIVDTGSSNTWVGADPKKLYKPSSSAKNTGNTFNVVYGSGHVQGTEYQDTITIGQLKIPNQGVGAASTSNKFSGVDGVLGLGPTALSSGTLSPNGSAVIPTVVDNAFQQKLISAAILGVYFPPGSGTGKSPVGEMTLGGANTARMTSSVFYVPITTVSPSSRYWGISASITIGSKVVMPNNAGVVDTGTTLVLLATDAFKKYVAQIPKAVVDPSTSFVRFPKASLKKVPNITVKVSTGSMVLRRYAQIVPPSVYSEFGLDPAYYYSWVGDLGTTSGKGMDFLLGQKFLERFYSIYDTPNRRIGFATTAYSNPTTFPI